MPCPLLALLPVPRPSALRIGTPNVPMMAFSEQKRAYMARDMQEWLSWWKIEMNWPSKFPIRSVLPLRAAIVQPAIWHHVCTCGRPPPRRRSEPQRGPS